MTAPRLLTPYVVVHPMTGRGLLTPCRICPMTVPGLLPPYVVSVL
jgi:hypothetical protein